MPRKVNSIEELVKAGEDAVKRKEEATTRKREREDHRKWKLQKNNWVRSGRNPKGGNGGNLQKQKGTPGVSPSLR